MQGHDCRSCCYTEHLDGERRAKHPALSRWKPSVEGSEAEGTEAETENGDAGFDPAGGVVYADQAKA